MSVALDSSATPRQRALDTYRRDARRCRRRSDLRSVHAGLQQLNQRLDASLESRPAEIATSAAANAYEQFARSVAQALDGGLLRYSLRQHLLQQAAQLGIAPFEAALLIAAVQHAARDYPDPPAKPSAGRAAWPCFVALLAEAALVAGAVWLLVS